MIKHDCITAISYSDDMTFEEVEQTEQIIRRCIESSLSRCSIYAFSQESTEDSCTFRYEIHGILPLHLLRDMANDIVTHLPHTAECRILIYSWNLGIIKGAVCKDGTYTLQSLDAIQFVGHRKIPFLSQEKVYESKIFS